MAALELKNRGWHLTEEGIEICSQTAGRKDVESLIKAALDTDLKDIGEKWLPDDINRGRADYVQGPGVLQVQKIRNISAPKDNEDSHAAPRLLRIMLTDGHIKCSAIETETLRDMGLNTPPGSKVLLKATTDVEHGFLLLNNKNMQYCGGRVSKLVEGWELKKKLSTQQRTNYGSGEEPPPFVPFGQRIDSSAYHKSSRRDNFKSLEVNKSEKTEDDEFEQQRKATIAEAMKAKEDGVTKKFGGGQKNVAADHDIAKITEMGFKPEEAASALKLHNSNVQQAIEYLLSGKRRGPPVGRGQTTTNRQSSYEGRDGDRGRGRRDRKDEDLGVPGKGRKGREPEESVENSKPSGPATLFDFLETKFPVSDNKGTKKDEKSTSVKSSDKPVSSVGSEESRNNQSSSSQSDGSSYSQSNRPKSQQNVPPRFVNKPRQDNNQTYNKGQGRYSERSDSGRDARSKNSSSDNRNYEEKSFGDRNYNDRFNDRNHERNFGDRDRNYGDRGGHYGDRGGNYGDRGGNYGDRGGNYGNRDRNYGDRDRNYGDRGGNYGDRGGNYGDRGGNYGNKDRSYTDKSFGDRDKSYGDREKKYDNRDRNYGDRDKNYDHKGKDRPYYERNYRERDSNYVDRNRNYGGRDRGSYVESDRNRGFDRKVSDQNGSKVEGNKNTNNNSSSSKSNSRSDYKESESKTTSGQNTDNSQNNVENRTKSNTQEGSSSQNFSQTENGNHVPNKGGNYDRSQNTKYNSYPQNSSYDKPETFSNSTKGGNPPPQTGYRTDGSQQQYGASNNYGHPNFSSSYNGNQPMVPNIHTSMGPYQQPEFIYTEVPGAYGLKRGDKVMAKYWEDSRETSVNIVNVHWVPNDAELLRVHYLKPDNLENIREDFGLIFYEAVVEVVAPNLPTCVVTFVEYGNSEEVFLTDVQPLSTNVPHMHQGGPLLQPPDLSVPPPQMFFTGPPPPHMTPGMEEAIQGISSMEFRRGGGGASYHRKDNRPAQQIYQPPGQRR